MRRARSKEAIAAEIRQQIAEGEASVKTLRARAAELREDADYEDPTLMAAADRLDESARKTEASIRMARAALALGKGVTQ